VRLIKYIKRGEEEELGDEVKQVRPQFLSASFFLTDRLHTIGSKLLHIFYLHFMIPSF
jgi:hypothetical protein